MKENLKMICVMGMVFINSLMVRFTVDSGRQTKCTEKVSTQQKEDEHMKASGTMARK
jgi:hypothetical protein